jgi:hypothetical protein
LNSLDFRTLYSRRYLGALIYLIDILKGKINCLQILDTVGIRVLSRQIRILVGNPLEELSFG